MRPAPAHMYIRKVGSTLRVTLPRELVTRLNLGEGDHVVLKEEDGAVKLRFVRLSELEQIVEPSAA